MRVGVLLVGLLLAVGGVILAVGYRWVALGLPMALGGQVVALIEAGRG